MRLTLRTLLAYRDGVLDPKDAAILEAKIKDSSTAQQISKRIDEEMANTKLAPIPVDAREFGFEANMVAEFLDDTISMESLPDMERKCLENNSLLGEIGSCHQILSRALTIPAPISASLRQRIRELPSNPQSKSSLLTNKSLEASGHIRRLDAAVVSAAAESGQPPSQESLKPNRNAGIELRKTGIELNDGLGRQVPEYLLGNDRSWIKRSLLGLALVASLVVVGSIAIGPLDRVKELLRTPEQANKVIAAGPKQAEKGSAVSKDGKSLATGSELKEEGTNNGPEEDSMDIEVSESSVAPPLPTSVAPQPAEPNPTSSNSLELPLAEMENKADASVALTPADKDKADVSVPAPPADAELKELHILWLPDSKPSSESLVFMQTQANWKRMNPGDKASAGERIVVPPSQRTELRIEPGIRWLCAGDNDLELQPKTKKASVKNFAGRSLIFATPDANSIEVDCNGTMFSIQFDSTDSSCALELQNVWGAVTDDMLKDGKIAIETQVKLIGVQGSLKYQTKGPADSSSEGSLEVGQYVDWRNGAPSERQDLSETPWWLLTSFERPIDQLASADLQRALATSAPEQLDVELKTLASHRRGETAALAARARMMLGKYDGLFEPDGVLNRKGLHSHWQTLLSQLPQSLVHAENVAGLVAAIRRDAPNRDSTILSLLVPMTQEKLESGGDKLLVETLSSTSMDERILASNQLLKITGKSLGYQPDKSSVESIQQWRKLLGKSEIRYPESKNQKVEVSQ